MSVFESLDSLKTRVWPQMAEQARAVLARRSVSPLVSDMITYQMESPGKRMRPVLSYVAAMQAGAREQDAVKLGAAIEVIHNASLVHDDIQDRDEYRRGRAAAWKAFSPRQAINLGDMLMTLAIDNLLTIEAGPERVLELMQLMVLTISQLINGQVLDIASEGREHDWDDYYAIASGKTGALFRMALIGGTLLGKEPLPEVTRLGLGQVGSDLGVLFQMRDDIIEITGTKEGRPFGEDLRAQKASMLHIMATRYLKGAQLQSYYSLCCGDEEGRPATPREDVLRFLREHGVMDAALRKVAELRSCVDGHEVLRGLPRLMGAVSALTALLCDQLIKE